MISNLIDDIQEMEIQVDLVINSNENKIVIEHYKQISLILDKCDERLDEMLRHKCALLNIMTAVKKFFPTDFFSDFEIKLEVLNNTFCALSEEWTEKDHLISQSSSLSIARDRMSDVKELQSTIQNMIWTKWVQDQRNTFHEPQELIETQKDIPHLSVIYQNYMQTLEKFNTSVRIIPSSTDIPDEIISYAKKLQKLREQMEFNLPTSVQRFYEELNKGYGHSKTAPLSLLTKEVFEWLSEKNELANFVVKRR